MHFRAIAAASILLLAPLPSFAQTRATAGTINIPGLDPMVATTTIDPAAITTTTAAPVTVPTPAPTPKPAPTAAVPKPSLEQVQQAAETAADLTSGPLSNVLSAIAGALGGVITLLGIQQALKQGKEGGKKCPTCGCSEHGPSGGVCARCNGTKEVEQEYEPKMDCAHCEGSGEDPEERRDEHGKLLDCEECDGEGEVSAKLNVSVPCPDCN